jgi:hypothetical protein
MPPWSLQCHSNDPGICANIASVRSQEADPGAEEPLEGHTHYCEFYEDQALIAGLDVDPAGFGFEDAEAADLFVSEPGSEQELVEAQGVIDRFLEAGVGIYKLIEPSDDLFARLVEVQSAGYEQASPHYFLRPAPFWRYGPYSTLQQLDPAWTWDDLDTTGPSSEQGPRLVIIDTGAVGDLAIIGVGISEQETVVDARVQRHGNFAAAIAKQYNPNLEVDLYRASFEDGTLSEASVDAAFARANTAGAVVSLSLGTYPCAENYDPLGLEIAFSGTVVAASGNDGYKHDPQQLYPASHPDVIGVSAYDTSWGEATWANPGEVYAPGEDIVSLYGDDGSLGVWSGSSFATPHYAACLASGVCQP